jgi:hypothetical protein
MTSMQRLLREPLLHFLLLGGMIFALYVAVSEPAPPPTNTITISPARIEQLSKSYQAVWRHPPSDQELDGIIENEIRDEVYYREALALGLDTNDTIIRRRLRQKMEFLTDSGAGVLEPIAGELETHLLANEGAFRSAPKIAFEQIYLGREPNAELIEQSLQALRDAAPDEELDLGVRTMLPAELGLSSPQAVNAVFGEGFFVRLAKIPGEGWAGPVESSFGSHLVLLGKSAPAHTPPLEEIREIVLRDWKAAKAREIRELYYSKLRDRYVVEIDRAEISPAEIP